MPAWLVTIANSWSFFHISSSIFSGTRGERDYVSVRSISGWAVWLTHVVLDQRAVEIEHEERHVAITCSSCFL